MVDTGSLAWLGAMFAMAGVARRSDGNLTPLAGPRWLRWAYLAALGTCLFYVFYRFP